MMFFACIGIAVTVVLVCVGVATLVKAVSE